VYWIRPLFERFPGKSEIYNLKPATWHSFTRAWHNECSANYQGGRKLKLRKCFLLLLLLLICASSSLAQKRSAKASAPAAQPKQAITPEEVARISVDELILMMANKKPVVIIDVRHGDYSTKIKGALQIPLDEIEARMKEIPRNKEIVTYCA
jgi:hypothetical protein